MVPDLFKNGPECPLGLGLEAELGQHQLTAAGITAATYGVRADA